MINQDNIHLLNSLQKLEEAGFIDQVVYRNGALINLTRKKSYKSNQVVLCHELRFEGMTDPGDESILFAIQFHDNSRGTLAAPYGAYGDEELFTFLDGLECNHKAHD